MLHEQTHSSRAPSAAPPPPPLLGPVPSSERPAQAGFELPLLSAEELPSVSLGIRVKLVALMVATSFLIVGVLASYFPARQIAELRVDLRGRADMYGNLASLQLRPAVAFKDRQTAREVLSAIAKDPLVLGTAVYSEDGARLALEGRLSELSESARRGFEQQRTYYLPGRVLVIAPIRTLEGPKGAFLLELSTQSAIAARNQLIRVALLIGTGALMMGSILAWAIASSLAKRVEVIARAAAAVAKGDLQQRLQLTGPRDEIFVLASGFDAMVRRLRDLIQHIHASAREDNERLERLVSERTRELDRRNADLMLVLDNVEQGLVTIARDGSIVGERSRAIDEWLGPLSIGESLWGSLNAASPGLGLRYEVAWSEVVDDVMPVEVSLAQMPHDVTIGGRHLRFEYKPLGEADSFEKLLVVMSDVTASVERDRKELEGRDILGASARVLADRAGFLEFVDDTRGLLRKINECETDTVGLKRDLHTLKGNAAIFGLPLLASLCHAAESALEQSGSAKAECASLTEQWQSTCSKLQHLLGERPQTGIEVDEVEYEFVLTALRKGIAPRVAERMVAAWRLEPVRRSLERAGEHLVGTVQRLDKGPIEVVVDAPRIYLDRSELGEFWTVFAHIVRNAAVHGLQASAERERVGKRGAARFTLRAALRAQRFLIELQDSGAGIDWEALRERSAQLGLRSDTKADLIDALFADGVSTHQGTDELAGRGVGLSAVRAVCDKMGASIEVDSQTGIGTCFRFSWPLASLDSLVSFPDGEPS